MAVQEIQKYQWPVRILHWCHTASFIVLFLTGLMFLLPGLKSIPESGLMHQIHRAAAAVFTGGPLLFFIINPLKAFKGIKYAFTWHADDFTWFKEAPRYYLLNDEKHMPAQGFLNSGQKLWWLITLVAWLLSVVTGFLMAFSMANLPVDTVRTLLRIHDISFAVTGIIFFLHIYTSTFHPLNAGALKAMLSGKISTVYAEKHHGKWYREQSEKMKTR